MISQERYDKAREEALSYYEKAHIILSEDEKQRLEIADFGLDDLEATGLQIITYINTDRVCAKEMVLFPGQSCPEHRHPAHNGSAGKEETFRCRYGRVYLYVEGTPVKTPTCSHPKGVYTVFFEVVLNPGEQYTIYPDTLHWFQAGDTGAVISEFSTNSSDETDIFTDPQIKRTPEVES